MNFSNEVILEIHKLVKWDYIYSLDRNEDDWAVISQMTLGGRATYKLSLQSARPLSKHAQSHNQHQIH